MKVLLIGFVAAIVFGGGIAKADFTFGEAVNLGPTINSSSGEGPDCVSFDGLEMYFDSNQPSGYGGWDIWVTSRPTPDGDWGAPVNLGPTVNTGQDEACASLSADGLELYFHSTRSGGYGIDDIWVTRRITKNDPWDQPTNLGPIVNSSAVDRCPGISSDGLELYFISERPGGQGHLDIWVTRRATRDDPWGEPMNLGPTVNSSVYEFSLFLSSDGLILFFSDDRHSPFRLGAYGDGDTWMSRRASVFDPWGVPVSAGPMINTSQWDGDARISPDGSTLYFSSERPGGYGGLYGDIYQAPIIPIVDFNGDGIVDIGDLVILIESWGTNKTLCDIGPMPWGDGMVDEADLEILMSYWGQEFELLPFDLVAYWRLDETEGDIAYDSAIEYDSIVNGDPLWQPEGGMVDGAIELDGINDYISTPSVLNPVYGVFSVFAWIKGGAPGQVVISQAGGENWLLADASQGKLSTELKGPGRSSGPLVSQTVITDGDWHRVGLVWDGSSRTLYVDDVEVATDTQGTVKGSAGGLYIGAGKALKASSFFSGLIDDVRIYNRGARL